MFKIAPPSLHALPRGHMHFHALWHRDGLGHSTRGEFMSANQPKLVASALATGLLFGVGLDISGMASREAYLIDRSGKVVYYDKGQTDQQADKVLAYLREAKK